MTIVEFLTARLDEEQQLADASRSTLLIANLDRCKVPGSAEEATFRHHERWEPYRVLADVAAKRRIIEWALVFAEDVDGEWGDGHTAAQIKEGQCTGHGSEAALSLPRLLAQPYADHPDFDPAWSVA